MILLSKKLVTIDCNVPLSGELSLIEKKIERWLRGTFHHKELGWESIGEKFTRYRLLKTRFFNVYLHQLSAPKWEESCHDHPWTFITLLLWRGYLERVGATDTRRHAGSVLYRPATFKHAVTTPYGTSWSVILTGPTKRQWGYVKCKP